MPSTPSPARRKKAAEPEGHTCGYCNKTFRLENSLVVHLCPIKQRDISRDEKVSRMAVRVYIRFYELNAQRGKPKTWDEFIRSRYYNDFWKVGRYICDINAVNTPQFIDFLIRSSLPLKEWTSPAVYETYVRELNKKESPSAAVERNILLMQQWAADTGESWTDFFRKVAPAQATMWIKSGRISPWVLYISGSAPDLFERMSPEQLGMVRGYLDPSFWEIMINRHKEDVEFLRQVLDEAGV
jgi:hypothetical protein